MTISLYLATLKIGECKGVATITAYDGKQAKEVAENFWEGYKEYAGNIEVSAIEGITCDCVVANILKVLCGNSLMDVLNMKEPLCAEEQYHIGNYIFDTVRQILTDNNGQSEGLTTREAELLTKLVQTPNKLIERDFLLNQIWGESNYYNSRSMDVYITKLRKHLNGDPRIEIVNVHGKGFRLVVPE